MNIIKHKNIFLIIAAGIVLVSAGIVAVLGFRVGIDFTGGSLMEVRYTTVPAIEEVEAAITPLNLGEFSVRRATNDIGEGYIVMTRTLEEAERTQLEAALTTFESGEVVQFTSIGPVIGQELRDKAVWALAAVLGLIIVYVAFAFSGVGAPVSSWVYGFMTIIVLAHDILVPIAFVSLMGYFAAVEIDVLFVTVLLTILGFSVNDTIVIFDRIREKLKKFRIEHKETIPVIGGKDEVRVTYTLTRPFGEIVDEAINETIARSINTSFTLLIALFALYLFGSSVTKMFTLSMMVGVVAGAYSSIFIASPLLVFYQEWQEKRLAKKTTT